MLNDWYHSAGLRVPRAVIAHSLCVSLFLANRAMHSIHKPAVRVPGIPGEGRYHGFAGGEASGQQDVRYATSIGQ